MKKLLSILSFTVLFASASCSQNKTPRIFLAENVDSIMALVKPKYKWMGTEGLTVTDKLKMKYRKPKGFQQDGASECFKEYPNLERTFGCEDHRLCSKDGQFLSFLSFVYFPEDHQKLYYLYHKRKETVDAQQYWQRRAILKDYYGDAIGESWVDSIAVYSTEEARKKWNADSAFTFSLHLRPEDYYKKDFKHVKILMIQKKGQGYAYITSFYTDKAKENFDKYWRRIEKTLRFED